MWIHFFSFTPKIILYQKQNHLSQKKKKKSIKTINSQTWNNPNKLDFIFQKVSFGHLARSVIFLSMHLFLCLFFTFF